MMNRKIIPFPGIGSDKPDTDRPSQIAEGESAKIIQFPEAEALTNGVVDTEQVDDDGMVGEYLDLMKDISCQLQQIAELFDVSPKEVMIDLTYIFVGNDILRNCVGDEDGDDESEDDDD